MALVDKSFGPSMGTLPVFMTAISTILGAILFLRFGYAIGHVGLIGTIAIIVIGHLVTIPTAMAVAEIATNQKVEGGGAYFMISRSFGLNIGAAIGIALFLSQAISVAFYVIAFAESVEPLRQMILPFYEFPALDKKLVGIGVMAFLTVLMLSKGANIGVKALYFVVVILLISLALFFMGSPYSEPARNFTTTIRNPDSFFYVFTIIFPAFTGIAAGLGLSGDLKDPKKSIPRGTLWATVAGIVVYFAVAFKLYYSAGPNDLCDQMIMADIAIWPPIIPIGLACAAISSALGSIIIAPRTLQALGADKIFPGSFSEWFARGKKKDNEPINSSILTCVIAFVFVAIGELDVVAQIISMFFMVTYGAICLISFMEHFAADPSYRPTFKSRWYFSLFGALLCFYLMFKMNFGYAILSIGIMFGIYFWVTKISVDKQKLAKLFRGVIFQMSRQLQIFLQNRDTEQVHEDWRPFIVCISRDSFKRRSAFDMLRWLSHKYGFGTYIHLIEGMLNNETYNQSIKDKHRLVNLAEGVKSRVFLETIISPSFTSALAQVIQISGVSGKSNNMILFEYNTEDATSLIHVFDNYNLLQAAEFDVCILRSTYKGFGYHRNIHLWVSPLDHENSNLMILLAYILLGHPDWKNGSIKIFSLYNPGKLNEQKNKFEELISMGRLPISIHNLAYIEAENQADYKKIINEYSSDADLTILGYDSKELIKDPPAVLYGYEDLGNLLFVSAIQQKEIR